jgi:hypothetical protein
MGEMLVAITDLALVHPTYWLTRARKYQFLAVGASLSCAMRCQVSQRSA